MWIVYVLLSLKDSKRYIGSTNNIQRRLVEHNQGLVQSTRHRRPMRLLYTEDYVSEYEARVREKFFKTHKGYNELQKLLKNIGL